MRPSNQFKPTSLFVFSFALIYCLIGFNQIVLASSENECSSILLTRNVRSPLLRPEISKEVDHPRLNTEDVEGYFASHPDLFSALSKDPILADEKALDTFLGKIWYGESPESEAHAAQAREMNQARDYFFPIFHTLGVNSPEMYEVFLTKQTKSIT